MVNIIRQSINPEVPAFYGAVRLVKVETYHNVDVLTQRRFVDVTKLVPLAQPVDFETALEHAGCVADSYDAEVREVLATISDHEARGLPILWIVATCAFDDVEARMCREMRECLNDHGRYNVPTPTEWDRQICRRLERGLVYPAA